MDGFKDKVAIVTGGASGIGRELCRQLGGHGATVIVADINREGAEEAASSIAGSTPGRARGVFLDVTQAEGVRKLIQDTATEFGRLDYMFNNAGIASGGEMRDMDWEHWRRMLDINLMGVIYGARAAYSVMVEQGFGHIVNTASGAGLFPIANSTPYVTTKHGVVGLSRSLRAEGADLGVKVSVVCPAMVDMLPVSLCRCQVLSGLLLSLLRTELIQSSTTWVAKWSSASCQTARSTFPVSSIRSPVAAPMLWA